MAHAKLNRLMGLWNLLLRRELPVSRREIRASIPEYPSDDTAFHRAFERDKETLRNMGVPIETVDIAGTDPIEAGYVVSNHDSELPDLGLTETELEALNLARAVVSPEGDAGRHALYKLGVAPGAEGPLGEVPLDAELVTVFDGVRQRRRIEFSYGDLDRVVEPHRMVLARGRWYLLGYDVGRADQRCFRLSRVQGSVQITDEPDAFERPDPDSVELRLDPYLLGEVVEPEEVEIWFDALVAPMVRRSLDAATVVSDDDTGLVVKLTITNPEGLRHWLVSFLDRAELISPPHRRQEMIDWLEQVAAGEGAR